MHAKWSAMDPTIKCGTTRSIYKYRTQRRSALQRTDRHATEEHSGDVQGLPEWKPLHSRLIEVNSQMTEKVRDLEQTVSGYKDNQCNSHAGIDFSKIEADLTELKTFLYKQQRLARETRSQEAKD